jgi:hypothetical protein
MNSKRLLILGCAIVALSGGAAQAGPCNTVGTTASHDAGSGPTPGNIGQAPSTVEKSDAGQHPPTDTMNRATSGVAASSEDAQKQMQGQPTDSQQAQGAQTTGAKLANQGC